MEIIVGIPPGREPWQGGTFECVKHNKRLWIKHVESGELVYTPPDFIRSRIQDRDQMRVLARDLSEIGRYDINTITEFETRHNPRLSVLRRSNSRV
jgi:hypothetical protein